MLQKSNQRLDPDQWFSQAWPSSESRQKNIPDAQPCIILILCPFLPGEPTGDQMMTVHIKVGERAAVRVQCVTHRQTLRVPGVIITN